MAKQALTFAGRQVQMETLDTDENNIVVSTVRDYIVGGCDELSKLFNLNMEAILLAAGVAKDKLAQAIRGQIAGDNEIGLTHIRPGHVLRTTSTTETPVNTWSIGFTAGNQYWIGMGSTYATAMNISQYLVVLAFGLMFTQGATPTIEEVFPQVGNTLYPGIVVRNSWLGDNNSKVRIARFHPILMEARQTSLWSVNALQTLTNEMVLLGVTFGPGRYLRKTSYAASDLP